ncbi:hypothetical protein [Acinetobacter baretiae]|nr:hypothetical protein [Acinetobacter baretiae]
MQLEQADIQVIENALNSRPRKCLSWQAQNNVMAGFYTVTLVT